MTRLVWTLPDGESTARWATDPGGGSQPLSFCYLEMNTPPNDGNPAVWDTIYGRDGFSGGALPAIPASMGMELNVAQDSIEVTETGLWQFALMVQPTADDTAKIDILLGINGDYSGGPRVGLLSVATADYLTLESCQSWTSALTTGNNAYVVGYSVPGTPTAPGYKPLGYAVLTLVRLG